MPCASITSTIDDPVCAFLDTIKLLVKIYISEEVREKGRCVCVGGRGGGRGGERENAEANRRSEVKGEEDKRER